MNFPVPRPTVIFEDNQGAIQIVKNPEHHKRTKHIDIKHHFIRYAIGQELIELISTDDQQADILTKGLPGPAFQKQRQRLGLLNPEPYNYGGVLK
ncbi:hypothetical protein JTB14_011940 [Gonioctena quinquepunctata]|nr:hypothetical protein JTB14_011940 [Gonioctena quinquepunctata]